MKDLIAEKDREIEQLRNNASQSDSPPSQDLVSDIQTQAVEVWSKLA